jgi:hypothetical protein
MSISRDPVKRGTDSLKNLVLSNLTKLESIGDEFVSGRTRLENLELINLTNLKSIGHDFAEGTLIKTLVLSNLSHLAKFDSFEKWSAKNQKKYKNLEKLDISNTPLLGR